MAKVTGVKDVQRELLKHQKKLGADVARIVYLVGYTAAYAIYVHENREMKWAGEERPSGLGQFWGPNGRAGFLLDVAREMRQEIVDIINRALSSGATLDKAVMLAALAVQRQSQLNVPVEYGNLRASAFTRKEE